MPTEMWTTRMHSELRRAPFFFLALFLLGACGEGDGSEEGVKTSGLPGELRLSSLDGEKREVFCTWYDSVVPSEKTCPRKALEGEAPPTCLDKFEHFGNCTVEEVEGCLASASASACDLPDTEACRAFLACQQEAAPANDCPDFRFVCTKFHWWGDAYTWGACWSWWPMGCFSCDGTEPTKEWAEAWCEERHPEECKGRSCIPMGDVLVD